LVEEAGVLDEEAGVEAAAGADEGLSDPELDFAPAPPDAADDESLPPSLDAELAPPSDFGAAEDFEG
jgi:hypothetical protein